MVRPLGVRSLWITNDASARVGICSRQRPTVGPPANPGDAMPQLFTSPTPAQVGRPNRLRRELVRHRRLVAALLAGCAVLVFTRAVAPHPVATVEILAAAVDLPAGHVLKTDDLTTRSWPQQFANPAAFTSSDQAVGRLTASEISAGEPLGANRIIAPGVLDGGLDPSLMAASVRLADSGETKLLRPGDHVDLLAARGVGPGGTSTGAAVPAETVAANVRVLAIPGQDDEAAEGILGSGSGSEGGLGAGALIVVAVESDAARRLAAAAANSRLSAVLRPIDPAPTPSQTRPASPSSTLP